MLIDFVKKTWSNRVVQYPNRRRRIDTGQANVFEYQREEGTIFSAGDPFNQATMNNLEERIYNAVHGLAINTSGNALDIMEIKAIMVEQNFYDFVLKSDMSFGDTFEDDSNINTGATTATYDGTGKQVKFTDPDNNQILTMNDESFPYTFTGSEMRLYPDEVKKITVKSVTDSKNFEGISGGFNLKDGDAIFINGKKVEITSAVKQ